MYSWNELTLFWKGKPNSKKTPKEPMTELAASGTKVCTSTTKSESYITVAWKHYAPYFKPGI